MDPVREFKATWLATQVAGRWSARIAGRFASHLWFTPWPVPVSERARAKQEAWLAASEPMTFDVGTHRVAGYVAGRGPTVLMLHGWGERAAFLGAFFAPLAGAGYRVVGIDLPGHGATSKGRTDIFEASRVVRSVADQLGGIDAVVAHSMGGYVATTALAEGLRANGVVLLAPASDVNHVMAKFEALFSLPSRAMTGLRADIERRWGRGVWKRLDARARAPRFSARALIVHDREDPQIDVSESLALAEAWPNARTLITEGLGHDRATRDPKVIAAARDFLLETVPVGTGELVSSGA